ncbi:SpoIIE family protein phosphatase [Streptacidiphilus neutrinimicus]|uniref:SpoIIE family protein phosphatase n=1 Tax=Streptacidiphilus neutrinimicus TaxID=105420 RepID=UPI000A634732|nr:SpoIIE family protein phosphatase [Streptacidiphilus neutrinimicus]
MRRADARARLRRRPAAGGVGGIVRRAGSRAATPAPFPDALAVGAELEEGVGRRTESLLDLVRVAIALLDEQGRVMLWSHAAEELLGWPSDALVGRDLEVLLGDDAEMYKVAHDAIAGVLRDAESWSGIVRLQHHDGQSVRLEARLSLLENGDGVPFLLCRFADAAALLGLEQGLAVQEALFEQSPLGLAIFDRDLRYVRINETLARMNGLPVEAHLGRTAGEALPQLAADEVMAVQRQVLATGEPVIDVTVNSADPGEPGYRSVSYSRLHDRSGRILGLTGMIMDVTDRYRSVAKVEHARQRLALLNEVGSRIGDLLDAELIAQELAGALVPRLGDHSGVALLEAVLDGSELPRHPHTRLTPLIMAAAAAVVPGPDADAMQTPGARITMTDESLFGRVLRTGMPLTLDAATRLEDVSGQGDPRVRAAYRLGVHSMLVVPLRARGIVLGLLILDRAGRREGFDHDDVVFATELADRAGASLDNARLYARERAAALMLQRSLLPQSVAQPPGMEVGYRYVPGSSGAEVGGDWFDVIPLPRGRTALVVGDVMGHGLRAAATMGRLRTAVRTLAGLDLPPHRLLQKVHDLADDLAQGPEEALIATCVYAVYDPSAHKLVLSKAGHTEPLLITPTPTAAPGGERLGGGSATVLALPSGAPLGVGGVPFEVTELTVPEGSLLALYTDGLVESRTEDIDVGTRRLSAVLELPHASVEEACEAVVRTLDQGQEPDDVALLLARLGGTPEPTVLREERWTLSAEPSAPAHGRRLVRATLHDWDEERLLDTTELLVSELVTNAVRYASAPIGLRLALREETLLVEVADPLPDPPREREAAGTDEGGRGLQLVHRLANRWGTRAEGEGKVVWFEQIRSDVPGETDVSTSS